MSHPKISVIIATYNVEDYIAETMESLLAQDFAAHEILIINDGSTDGTLALLESAYAGLDNVRIHTQANQGVGVVRETGFAQATGDYIFFCDPDDVVDPELFKRFAAAIAENAALELFYFSKRSFIESDTGRRILRRNTAASREGWYAQGTELLEDLILSKKYKPTVWQYIFKKSMTTRFNVSFKGRAQEDQLFSMNVYLNSQCCYATRKDLYFQRVRSGSLTNSLKDEQFVWSGYAAYRDVIAVLKPKLQRFKNPQGVALIYMRGRVNFLIDRCVKNHVSLPPGMPALTRQDARECGTGLQGGLTLMAPEVVFRLKRLRFNARRLSKLFRRRAG
jgi:glycosyltransferase involved in cell wall biosynthesis